MPGDRTPLAGACEAVYRETLARLGAGRLVSGALGGAPPRAARVLALGKAAGPMAGAALRVLGARALDALCVLPEGSPAPAGARAVFGTHPRPGAASLEAGRAVLAWAERGRGEALVLLSGGASALAVAPADGVAFEDKVEAVALLMRAGRTIGELNCLRKHLSRLKGGRLGVLLAPGPVEVLVLSDVPGHDLSVVGSGPLVADPSTFADAERIVRESGVAGRVPRSVLSHLARGARGEVPETPKPGDARLAAVRHRVLAGPVDLARVAAAVAEERGFEAEADPGPVTGDVGAFAERVLSWVRARAGTGRPRLLAAGGEPTVRVPPDAVAPHGGRAQHLALLAAGGLEGLEAAFLAAGSDGRDGPTDQAGAVVDGETAARARAAGLDLARALGEGRSGPAVRALGVEIPRFETGTHLCDLHLVAVR